MGLSSLGEQRVRHLLRDLSDEPFVAMVIPTDGEAKIYVKGIEPEQMVRIQQAVERILSTPKDANPDEGCYTLPDGDCVGVDCMHSPRTP